MAQQALGSDHAAAAGALGNLTKTLGVEWARDGIRVNAIQTGEDGETLGNLAAYLVSPQACYINGEMVAIDGGAHLRTSGAEDLLQWGPEAWAALRTKRTR